MMARYPERGKKLFLGLGGPYDFSYFGWGDREKQFYGYAGGYKKAADILVRSLAESTDLRAIDTCVFPLCFLYRHFIELSLKQIYLAYTSDTEETQQKVLNSIKHRLKPMWQKVRSILHDSFPWKSPEALDAVEDYISQFEKEDPYSSSYRYPITLGLAPVHESDKRINLHNLAERMDELESFFSGAMADLEDKREVQREIRAYYSVEEDEWRREP